MITGLLTDTIHTADTEQRLYSLAAQTSRLCGWLCLCTSRRTTSCSVRSAGWITVAFSGHARFWLIRPVTHQ
jgi:hypothetical protein